MLFSDHPLNIFTVYFDKYSNRGNRRCWRANGAWQTQRRRCQQKVVALVRSQPLGQWRQMP
jgi:hypothetical protein